ncbi:MAG TPA: ferritin family protein [Kofleriaceae bacterium]|nr:ferritin family protein [Kofleriaceae bacterium]
MAAAVGAAWRHRERVEREAAALFAALAGELDAVGYPALASRARAAADDERRHAARCRAIVDACAPGLAPLPVTAIAVAPAAVVLDRRAGALYASVAMGCVTETLSCALLLAMRAEVTFAPVVAAVDEIVKDEIEHGRLGWAHLAVEAARGDVAWLGPHVTAMRTAALTHDVEPLLAAAPAPALGAYGLLSRAQVAAIVDDTWRDVIVPGLARAGIAVAAQK